MSTWHLVNSCTYHKEPPWPSHPPKCCSPYSKCHESVTVFSVHLIPICVPHLPSCQAYYRARGLKHLWKERLKDVICLWNVPSAFYHLVNDALSCDLWNLQLITQLCFLFIPATLRSSQLSLHIVLPTQIVSAKSRVSLCITSRPETSHFGTAIGWSPNSVGQPTVLLALHALIRLQLDSLSPRWPPPCSRSKYSTKPRFPNTAAGKITSWKPGSETSWVSLRRHSSASVNPKITQYGRGEEWSAMEEQNLPLCFWLSETRLHYTDQAGLQLTEVCLPRPPEC